VPQTMLLRSATCVPHTMLSAPKAVPHTMLSPARAVPHTMLSPLLIVPHTTLSPVVPSVSAAPQPVLRSQALADGLMTPPVRRWLPQTMERLNVGRSGYLSPGFAFL